MSEEWVAALKRLPKKPETVAIATQLRKDPYLIAAWLVFDLWSYADTETEDGVFHGFTIERLAKAIGRSAAFLKAVEATGWLEIADGRISCPNWERWNPKTARKRAMAA